jgi:DNA-binding transcriptional ArsR family regulator
MLDRRVAEDYASWFRCLADPTRIQILHLLAANDAPMTVGQIVRQVGVGQSTVSHHLKVLAQVRFVLVEHAGTSSHYQVNPNCLAAFPTAADIVIGHRPTQQRPATPTAPAAQLQANPS